MGLLEPMNHSLQSNYLSRYLFSSTFFFWEHSRRTMWDDGFKMILLMKKHNFWFGYSLRHP